MQGLEHGSVISCSTAHPVVKTYEVSDRVSEGLTLIWFTLGQGRPQRNEQ